ncbi:AEC family transporter [Lampropedia aestuarii]|nr:AEC family transporter [Lampropedia aestuarii]
MLQDYLNILVLFLVVGLGFCLARAKWLDESSNSALTKILLNVALPATLILSIGKDYTKPEFLALLPNIILPALVILSLMLAAWAGAKIMHIEKGRTGLFIGVCAMSSTIMMGIPITLAVYGSHGLPFALMTYASQTLIYWTLGLYLLQKDSSQAVDGKSLVAKMVKEIFNMPLLAFFVGVVVLLSGLHIPDFIADFFSYLSGMTSGLAMLVIGAIIYITGFKGFRFSREIAVVIAFRFVFAPVLAYALGMALSVPVEMIKITILMVSLPIPNTTVILAKKYEIDVLFATESLSFSIAAYLVFLPVILFVIHSM